jgi:hypothetical protein
MMLMRKGTLRATPKQDGTVVNNIETGCKAIVVPHAHHVNVGLIVTIGKRLNSAEAYKERLDKNHEWWEIDQPLLFNDGTLNYFACTEVLMRIDDDAHLLETEETIISEK